MSTEDAVIYVITWRGITIEVTHVSGYLASHLDHIAVETKPRTPLPITQTGYRSHFIDPEDLTEYEGAGDFVRFWLDSAGTDWDGQLTFF